MSNASKQIIQRFKDWADNTAIIEKNKEYSYSDLMNKTLFYIEVLKKERIGSGYIVSLVSDYSFNSISLILALFQNNNIIVPITSSNDLEVKDRIKISQADVIIDLKSEDINITLTKNPSNKHSIIEELKSKNKSGLVLFSSGSTGEPKAMVHDLDILAESFLSKKTKRLNFLVFLLFDHIGGINTLFNCLSMGSIITVPHSRNPDEVCKIIERHKVQILPTSPTFLNLMLMSDCYNRFDLSSLILITYGTEPMPESLLIRLKEVFVKQKFLQTFGTSETGILKTSSKSNTSTLFKIENSDQEFKIVDNELYIKSKTKILGYLNYTSENFTKDGWFKTGDLVNKDDEGFLQIKGRKQEWINVGGEKVLPQEVEGLVLKLHYISDVLVYALPNPILGEIVSLDVVINYKESVPDNIKNDIRKFCKQNLEPYKVPVKINIVDKLTHSDRFKKLRKKL